MGREAQCVCTVGARTEAIKALLESSSIILHGSVIKQRFDIATLTDVEVIGPVLMFKADGASVKLELGPEESSRWVKKITTPPPSLAQKLGIAPELPAYVCGDTDDAALNEALKTASATDPADASVFIAIVLTGAELKHALNLHESMPCSSMWVVSGKGKTASLGDAVIRQTMRDHGYVDNKSCAVSDQLTATRYTRQEDLG